MTTGAGSAEQRAETILEFVDVTAGYGTSTVLSGLSLTVRRGEVVALFGANGVGKTTALRVAGGLLTPTSGEFRIGGVAVRLRAHQLARRGVGHVPEGRGIFPGLTVAENLRLADFSKPSTRDRAVGLSPYELFPRLGERKGQLAGSLSGGEQQMLAIARTLQMNPVVVLLDEPSIGLAPIALDDLYRSLAIIKEQGVSMLIAEQSVAHAAALSDAAYVLGAGGRVVAAGHPMDLVSSGAIYETYMS